MKILSIRLSVELIEAVLSSTFRTATPLECTTGLPKGSKLAEAHLVEDHSPGRPVRPTHLQLYFCTEEGEGVEEVVLRYRHVHPSTEAQARAQAQARAPRARPQARATRRLP